MEIDENIRQEISRQVVGLMKDHAGRIQNAFNLNGQELEITFKIGVESEPPAMEVKTAIAYLPQPKITDSAHGRVSPMPLFDENKFDRRTRLHCLWMIAGGKKVKGDFEAYLLKAA
jgi:hypothetical protein